MCGIAGIISATPLNQSHHEQLLRMSEALVHRGPDGTGLYQRSHLAMAMRRLSIIDLVTGWQPLYNEEKSLALIANGEIYNFVELRAQLQRRGHTFRTGSDCEVILHLYEEYGEDCVHHLRGMFAFALWDEQQKKLLLVRDRMGEKPLYLFEWNGGLAFASELKALLHSGVVPFELDPSAIDLYFHYQFVPEPATPLRHVRKLPAATMLTITPDPWRVSERVYWRMEDAPSIKGDPAEVIRAELETVSELIIRADVPVGVALSGGVDSSVIAGLTAKKYPGTLQAFSVGYEGRPRTDERQAAEELARHLSLPFHEIELSAADVVADFLDMVYRRDDPIADMAGYGYQAVMKAARAHNVPVMLMGQGADELFWGYPWLVDAALQSQRKAGGTGRLREYLRVVPPRFWPRRAPLDWIRSLAGLRSGWHEFRRDTSSPPDRLVFYDLLPGFQGAQRYLTQLCTPSFADSLSSTAPFGPFTVSRPWTRVDISLTRVACATYLLENGIAQSERLSMASSVELRLPFVDYRLVETVVGLRKQQSDLGLAPKAWLKQAIKDVVPEWVFRRPKRGFQTPGMSWLKPLFAAHGDLLADGVLVRSGVLSKEAAVQLSRPPQRGQFADLAFKGLVLEAWSQQCRSRCSAKFGR